VNGKKENQPLAFLKHFLTIWIRVSEDLILFLKQMTFQCFVLIVH